MAIVAPEITEVIEIIPQKLYLSSKEVSKVMLKKYGIQGVLTTKALKIKEIRVKRLKDYKDHEVNLL